MAAFAPPIPSGPGSPSLPPSPGGNAPGGPPPGLSGLVGGVPSTPPVGPTPQQRIEDYLGQIREISMQIDALATDHPEAADDLNQAKNALTNSMSKVAAASASPESTPQPPSV